MANETKPDTFAARLADAMAAANLTAEDMAKEIGSSETHVVAVMQGRKAPSTVNELLLMARACSVSWIWLCTGRGNREMHVWNEN